MSTVINGSQENCTKVTYKVIDGELHISIDDSALVSVSQITSTISERAAMSFNGSNQFYSKKEGE